MKTAEETLGRMEALVRRIGKAGIVIRYDEGCALVDEARAIIAELPEPVDPDLVEAREIVTLRTGSDIYASQLREGKQDSSEIVICVLGGIKRGRELERAGK